MIKGRNREIERLSRLAGEDGPGGIYLWGVAGIGKSTLVQGFLDGWPGTRSAVKLIDCAAVEPTERGFQEALGQTEAGLLVLDNYESFGLMDSWLLQHVRPRLGPDFRLLISGRTPPSTGWRLNAPGQPRVDSLELDGLPRETALEFLEASGLSPAQARDMVRLSAGHPLTLQLAASAGASSRVRDGDWSDVMHHMSVLYLEEASNPAVRAALEAASIPRRLTRGMLADLLPGEDSSALFDQLAALSFSRMTSEGLRLHEAIRLAIASTLRASDPERFRELRRQAWRHVRRSMASGQRWKYTADLIYLVDNPVVREAFFPTTYTPLSVRPAESDDFGDILSIAAKHEPEAAVSQYRQWIERQPDSFHVVTTDKGISGFYQVLSSAGLSPEHAIHDALVRQWLHHHGTQQVARTAPALFIRRWLSAESGEQPSAEQAACWLDLKRAYMEMRPELRRVYLCVNDLAPYAGAATNLGFQVWADLQVQIGGRAYHSAMLEFGSASVDGWISRLAAAELGLLEGSLLDVPARQLVCGSRRTDLTQLEFGVMEMLLNQSGRPVSREDMLERVWGSDSGSQSNVVDVIITALRRKLLREAGSIETVRGLGYRYTPPDGTDVQTAIS